MLKKRILASSMASVMALSSVSVVAFADETATADYGEAVDKAELKEYVKSFDNFLKDDIYEYGTVQAAQFQDAFDYAENVAASAKATTEEATAAYQMLKTVYEKMRPYTAEELQELIDDCTEDYETENILNADLGDKIWVQGTFDDFEIAYNDAKSYVNSGDGRLITDLYVELKDAHDALDPLPDVTKAEFRAVLREFEAIATKFGSYETWRRGTVSVNPTTGTNGKTTKLTDAYTITFEDLQEVVYGTSKGQLFKKSDGTVLKTSATTTWIAVVDKAAVSTTTKVADFVNDQYKRFDAIQTSKVTTDESINEAYAAAQEAVKVFNSWKADDTERAAKANIAASINKYRAKLANDYAQELIADLEASFGGAGDILADALPTYNDDCKWVAAKDFELKLDKATNLIVTTGTAGSNLTYDSAATGENVITKKIGKNQDIMKYIPVTAADVAATNPDPNATKVSTATELGAILTIVEAYAAAEAGTSDFDTAYAAGLDNLDENNIVAKPGGSRNEYTLINRMLTYVLTDIYPDEAKPATYTKKDVKDLIDASYDLCDDTGDAEIFKNPHMDLVAERKDALDWLTAANATKGYKDDLAITVTAGTATYDGYDATQAYEALKAVYDDLDKMFKAFPVSYGEIAEYIASVASDIEAGALKETEEIKTLLDDVAFGLSTLDATIDENEAFTSDREFISYNRLQVADYDFDENTTVDADEKASKAEKNLYANLQALKEAVAKAGETPENPDVVLGDLTGDGVATPEDAIMIVKAFVGEITLTDAEKAAADFNGDGVVNADDALAVVKAYVGL